MAKKSREIWEVSLASLPEFIPPELATVTDEAPAGDGSSIREIAQFVEDDGNLPAGDVD